MKIALVHGKFGNSWEALGLGYLAAHIKRFISDVEFVYYQGCFDADEDIVRGCQGADWVLFSCTSTTYRWAESILHQIRGNIGKAMIGGYHASAVPHTVHNVFDHVVVGEGEDATRQLLLGEVKNRFVFGRPMHFEELPWPDRRVIRSERNIAVAERDTGNRITSFQAHRGCPFGCKFCCDGKEKSLYLGGKANSRSRDPDDVLDEMEATQEAFNLTYAKFCDPTWNTKRDWVKTFARRKTERGISLPYFTNIHAAVRDEEMFEAMAASNCDQIGLGIESGSDRILSQVEKSITKDQVRAVVKWAKKYGIGVRGYFILGTPEETEEDLQQTEQFAEELQLDVYGFTILCPYPGTHYYHTDPSLWEQDWAGVDEYSNDFWHTKTVSNEQLKEWQARLVERFRGKINQHQREMQNDH